MINVKGHMQQVTKPDKPSVAQAPRKMTATLSKGLPATVTLSVEKCNIESYCFAKWGLRAKMRTLGICADSQN